ncbi:MAG: hypothetical protein PF503_21690 [Desulfobacula sp.]|nr:hypothetical protein [Desulfobacula sp.]
MGKSDELHAYGVTRIYSPEDGSKMGLQGMINDMMVAMDVPCVDYQSLDVENLTVSNKYVTANFNSTLYTQRWPYQFSLLPPD